VREVGRAIREAIEGQRDTLAKAIVERQWKIRPDLELRYGAVGYAKCLEDAHYHLRYLCEAIDAAEPQLFSDYISWAKIMLASRKVLSEDLASHLQTLRDVVADNLPGEMGAVARDYVNAALDQLPQYPLELPVFLDDREPLAEMAKAYLNVLLRYERHSAAEMILAAVDSGTSIKDIYRYVFERCQRELGRLWQTNLVSVAQEHYCTASTQFVMALLYPKLFAQKKEKNMGSLLAACVPGELHEIGPRMLCDLMEMEGWQTIYLGANVPIPALVQTVKDRKPNVLAISAAMTYHIKIVRQLIGSLRDSDIGDAMTIVVGGYAFRSAESLWRNVGADGFAKDAVGMMELLKGRHPWDQRL
jgi:MerR family transcriptional regulator, light-induced transcriptional regulator